MIGRHRSAAILAAILLSTGAACTRTPPLHPDDVERGVQNATAGVREVVTRLTKQDFAGRYPGTRGAERAREYLIEQLQRIGRGLGKGSGKDAYRQPFVVDGVEGVNLLAVIPGRERPDEVVIVGAHYDGLGKHGDAQGHCAASNDPGGEICPGATDNAAGVAAVLGIGDAISRMPVKPRRSVVLALWDAEEEGMLGSRAYVERPLVPLADTVAYVNFDIVGAVLLPSLRSMSFAVGAETGGDELRDVVRAAIASERLQMWPFSSAFAQTRSDNATFIAARVPSVFFTDATGGCYHTVRDTLDMVRFPKLRLQSRIGYRTVVALAESGERPRFVAPGTPPATYDDAVALGAVLEAASADLTLLEPADRETLQAAAARVAEVVRAGREAFAAADAAGVLRAAGETLAVLQRVPCRRY
ncbi:MAG TPA: M20/M25/M40 family metallo-hydrolase [Candidatus Binatia bacterium]